MVSPSLKMAYPQTLVRFFCSSSNSLAKWDSQDYRKEVAVRWKQPDSYELSIKLPSIEQGKHYFKGNIFRCSYHNTQYRYILHNEATLFLQYRRGVGEYSILKSNVGTFNFRRKIMNDVKPVMYSVNRVMVSKLACKLHRLLVNWLS